MSGYITRNLGIGEMYVSDKPTIVSTILGSCISVCLYSTTKGVGSIVHFALPDISHAYNSDRSDLNFGDLAIKLLLVETLKFSGVKKEDLAAKIVGGGNVMSDITSVPSIGELNIQMALKTLENLRIPVCGKHIGGNTGRKVYFYTDTGRLRVSTISSQR